MPILNFLKRRNHLVECLSTAQFLIGCHAVQMLHIHEGLGVSQRRSRCLCDLCRVLLGQNVVGM